MASPMAWGMSNDDLASDNNDDMRAKSEFRYKDDSTITVGGML